MSPFIMVSRNHVLNNEKSHFVDDSGYFTVFPIMSRQKHAKCQLKKDGFVFFKKNKMRKIY